MPEISNVAKQGDSDAPIEVILGRLPRSIAGAGAAGMLGCLILGQSRFAAGLGLGAAVALVGYWWLCRGVQAAFDSGRVAAPRIVLIKLALRYPLLAGVVLLFERTGWLPARAVVVGLFAPLAGVMIECLVLLAQALRGSRAPAEQAPRIP